MVTLFRASVSDTGTSGIGPALVATCAWTIVLPSPHCPPFPPRPRVHRSAVTERPDHDATPSAPSGRRARLELEGVGKRYVKYDDTPTLLGRAIAMRNRTTRSPFWAVRGVDLDVRPGETLGVIGRNGSGKSTMLRMLAGVTSPTEGRVTVRGRVAPLISVGVGFHPELTGRENVYVNGTVLGLTNEQIDELFDSIVDFAELPGFIDTPVKFYSSGMFVRLGFAVAVAAQPDVLLIDEVLAVGDLRFQAKCYERMNEMKEDGATVVLVTHNLQATRNMCDRTLVLHDGEPGSSGRRRTPSPCTTSCCPPRRAASPTTTPHRGRSPVESISTTLLGPDGEPTAYVDHDDEVVRTTVRFRDRSNGRCTGWWSTRPAASTSTATPPSSPSTPPVEAGQTVTVDTRLRAELVTGSYEARGVVAWGGTADERTAAGRCPSTSPAGGWCRASPTSGPVRDRPGVVTPVGWRPARRAARAADRSPRTSPTAGRGRRTRRAWPAGRPARSWSGGRRRARRRRRWEAAPDVVAGDDVDHACVGAGDDRRAAGERFDQDEPERLVDRRQDGDGGRSVPGRDLLGRPGTEQVDGGGDPVRWSAGMRSSAHVGSPWPDTAAGRPDGGRAPPAGPGARGRGLATIAGRGGEEQPRRPVAGRARPGSGRGARLEPVPPGAARTGLHRRADAALSAVVAVAVRLAPRYRRRSGGRERRTGAGRVSDEGEDRRRAGRGRPGRGGHHGVDHVVAPPRSAGRAVSRKAWTRSMPSRASLTMPTWWRRWTTTPSGRASRGRAVGAGDQLDIVPRPQVPGEVVDVAFGAPPDLGPHERVDQGDAHQPAPGP